MANRAKTLLRELKSLEGSTTQPWNRRVLGDAIKFVEDSMKGPVEQGWEALAKINAARALEGPTGANGVSCPGATGPDVCPHGTPYRYPCKECVDDML